MKEEFWHSHVTDKSFKVLQELRKHYTFVLIGGWAVFFYTKALKSKDIDIIVEPAVLGRLKMEFDVRKNERLKKYEIELDGFDVDIYLAHWSHIGLPAEIVFKNAVSREGFLVPSKEILLILKLCAYAQRKGSLKGKKDKIDIISLLYYDSIAFEQFKAFVREYDGDDLLAELRSIFAHTKAVEELNLNQKHFSDFKKKILSQL
ncbi:MAG: hypothetical protein HY445_03335 [Candidatus Niyogibacteria bacterium]|nr:hypothetical protein [Candidatus Niyogibacteria bacterium]